MADIAPCELFKFIFDIFTCQPRLSAREALLFMFSRITSACFHVLGKPFDEQLLIDYTSQITNRCDSGRSLDFRAVWIDFQETFELCEYVNSILALRHELAEMTSDCASPCAKTTAEGNRTVKILEHLSTTHTKADAYDTEVQIHERPPYLFANRLLCSMVQAWEFVAVGQSLPSSSARQLLSHRLTYPLVGEGFLVGVTSFESQMDGLFERLKLNMSCKPLSVDLPIRAVDTRKACFEDSSFQEALTHGICKVIDGRAIMANACQARMTKDGHAFNFLTLVASGRIAIPVVHAAPNYFRLVCVRDRVDSLRITYDAPRLISAVWHRPLMQLHRALRVPLILPPSAAVWRALELLGEYRGSSIAIASQRPAVLLAIFSRETWRKWLELKFNQAGTSSLFNAIFGSEVIQPGDEHLSILDEVPRGREETAQAALLEFTSSTLSEGLLTPIIAVVQYVTRHEATYAPVIRGSHTLSDAMRMLIDSPGHVDRLHIVTEGSRSNMVLVGALLVSDIIRAVLSGTSGVCRG
eukprot:CAMPEP_0198675398 /NCGR_PEP_ID=MMETSP1467-20131203/98398_1 /TAXON_ID=1462469 /ORGANISM="unid. sp., Strain CCMP2135" /LENGTH=525 /DNA_ID=CAMNT_0044412299 /DNA_START=1096 /DNA_END=2673 /DNA_ORIENTATION=+